MNSEIVEQLFIDNELEKDNSVDIFIRLNKKNLKVLKELHGDIGLDDFLKELSEEIKSELKEIL